MQIRAKLAKVSEVPCETIGLEPTSGKSRQGVPILAREINSTSQTTIDKPPARRILLIGGIHGDELTSTAIVLRWTTLLADAPARGFVWNIVPLANPDGFLAAKPSRVNHAGVDLNRNFATAEWHKTAAAYWKKHAGSDPRRYPGPSPLSEPESKWLDEEIKRFKPDVIISVHAPYALLDFDGPVIAPTKFGKLSLTPVGTYPGSLGNYSGLELKVPVITIELPHALVMPTKPESYQIWTDMMGWINKNIQSQTVIDADRSLSEVRVK